jgi:hypothetical protein
MKIYVAGPYSKGDTAVNVSNAVAMAERILERGHTPYIPHLTHFWHILQHHPYEFWLEYDKEWLRVCNAVFRFPGESSGADAEVKLANELGMIVYEKIDDIPRVG